MGVKARLREIRKMNKKSIFLILPAFIVVSAAALVLWFRSPSGAPAKVELINFGTVPTAATTLIYIAQDQRFFAGNRIRIDIKNYNTGMDTTEALLKGDLNIAWTAEFPLVRRALAKDEIGIIAVVGRFDEQVLFGRKDGKINTIADFKGKRIGIPRDTIAEFYLGRFLELNGMNIRDITLVNVPPPQSLEAITSGRVEGVIAWEPYSSRIRERLSDKAVALPIQSNQPGYGLITVRKESITSQREVVNRSLRSLAQAEDYLTRNPSAAKAIVRKWLKYDEAFTETIWEENQFSLSLDQSLIIAMEDEARWMIKNKLTSEKSMPNFLDYIHEDALKAIKPNAVNIIR
jgi:NitT/TauT family transport system substrate-binding protein